jgi:transmembrane sensor
MEKRNIKEILEQVEAGTASSEHEQVAKRWLFELNKHTDVKYTDDQLTKVNELMWAVIEQSRTKVPAFRLWRSVVAVAASIILVTGVAYYFYTTKSLKAEAELVFQNKIPPGKRGATISFSSGKTIQLSDAQNGVVIAGNGLSYMDGSSVAPDLKPRSGRAVELTAATAKGQTYIFALDDGTKVWLNADSKISFPQQFLHQTREVFVEGEAYFEVAKDKQRPFIVKSKAQQIEVLGTHFNVSTYANEGSEKTTLIEGSVHVQQIGGAKKEVVLKPGQQVTNIPDGLAISDVDPKDVLDWMNEGFAFNGGDFAAAMRKIARWYNVEIIYDPIAVQKIEIGGFTSRKNDLSTVLKFIESTGQVKFILEGRRVLVRN